MKLSRSVFAILFFLAALPAAAQPAPGWRRVEIPSTGSYFWRYVPQGHDASKPPPLVLFFHGAGTGPDGYRNFVAGAADKAGMVVAMPKSSGVGWGTGADEQTLAETLRLMREELPVDAQRIALAGHSAGGAWAYLLAYAGREYSAVFSLAAPFYPVASVTDASYKPPIRMYYGTTDPNYSGAYPALKSQWNRLGVRWEEDVQAGFGHNTWPNASMADGFAFLARQSRPGPSTGLCVPSETVLCLRDGRFRVEVSRETNGELGSGKVVPFGSPDSGLFSFFHTDNWELLVKVLDGCSVNGHYWVYSAATTDVRYILTVTDTKTGQSARYENPAGKPAPATTDVEAISACP